MAVHFLSSVLIWWSWWHRKTDEVSSWPSVLLAASGVAGHAEPQASGRNRVPAGVTVTLCRADYHPGWCFTGVLEHAGRGRIPGLRVQAKKFAGLIICIECCRVMPSAAE